MATTGHTTSGSTGTGASNGVSHAGRSRETRLSTETKAAPKTTEFIAYLVVLAGVLIAGLVVDGDGRGADGGFSPNEAWSLAVFLTIGYMISRGLAKAGSRDPYFEGGSNAGRGGDDR